MNYNWNLIKKKLYGILGSHDTGMSKISMFDEYGNSTIDPIEATRYFVTFSSKDSALENFVILVAIRNNTKNSSIEIKTPEFYSDEDFNVVLDLINNIKSNIGNKEGIKINWKDFDKTIDPRKEAENNIKESTLNPLYGTTRSSFQKIGNSKLIIRHTSTVDESKRGARSRRIKSIYIENAAGERFMFPIKSTRGARSFAKHISEGGNIKDKNSCNIFTLAEHYASLKRSCKILKDNIDCVELLKEAIRDINKKFNKLMSSQYALMLEEIDTHLTSINSKDNNACYLKILNLANLSESTDLEIAAKYIGNKLMNEKLKYKWSRKPTKVIIESDNIEGCILEQLSEMIDACLDESCKCVLIDILEKISDGQKITPEDAKFVKEVLSDGMKYKMKPIPEEEELTEFFESFSISSILNNIDENREDGIDQYRHPYPIHKQDPDEHRYYINAVDSAGNIIDGKIIGSLNGFNLVYNKDGHRNEYDVYKVISKDQWKYVENLNLPYVNDKTKALSIFREKYS